MKLYITNEFKLLLRKKMKETGYNESALSVALGKGPAFINQILKNNGTASITEDNLQKLSEVLAKKRNELAKLHNEANRPPENAKSIEKEFRSSLSLARFEILRTNDTKYIDLSNCSGNINTFSAAHTIVHKQSQAILNAQKTLESQISRNVQDFINNSVSKEIESLQHSYEKRINILKDQIDELHSLMNSILIELPEEKRNFFFQKQTDLISKYPQQP